MTDYDKSRPPEWLNWFMTFVNRVGFPIAVCIYLGYTQITMMPKLVSALEKVEIAVRDNTDVLKTWQHPRGI